MCFINLPLRAFNTLILNVLHRFSRILWSCHFKCVSYRFPRSLWHGVWCSWWWYGGLLNQQGSKCSKINNTRIFFLNSFFFLLIFNCHGSSQTSWSRGLSQLQTSAHMCDLCCYTMVYLTFQNVRCLWRCVFEKIVPWTKANGTPTTTDCASKNPSDQWIIKVLKCHRADQ